MRGIEHVKVRESDNAEVIEKSVLERHRREKHDNENVEYEMKLIASFQHDTLFRQCSEAV